MRRLIPLVLLLLLAATGCRTVAVMTDEHPLFPAVEAWNDEDWVLTWRELRDRMKEVHAKAEKEAKP